MSNKGLKEEGKGKSKSKSKEFVGFGGLEELWLN
jgi:hypothetical protein